MGNTCNNCCNKVEDNEYDIHSQLREIIKVNSTNLLEDCIKENVKKSNSIGTFI